MNVASNDSAQPRNHSKHGLISLGLAIITGLATILLLLITFLTEKETYTAQMRISETVFVFALIIAPFPLLIGLVLGIIGVRKKNSKEVFPVLGMIFNALPLVLIVVYWLFYLIVLALFNALGSWR